MLRSKVLLGIFLGAITGGIASATTIFDDLPASLTNATTGSYIGGTLTSYHDYGSEFETPDVPVGDTEFLLEDVTLPLEWAGGTGTAPVTVYVYTNSGGKPGTEVAEVAEVGLTSDDNSKADYKFTPTSTQTIFLEPDTEYWIVGAANGNGNTSVSWLTQIGTTGCTSPSAFCHNTLTPSSGTGDPLNQYIDYSTGTSSANTWGTGAGSLYKDGSNHTPLMEVDALGTTPEPGTSVLLGLGLLAMAFALRRRTRPSAAR